MWTIVSLDIKGLRISGHSHTSPINRSSVEHFGFAIVQCFTASSTVCCAHVPCPCNTPSAVVCENNSRLYTILYLLNSFIHLCSSNMGILRAAAQDQCIVRQCEHEETAHQKCEDEEVTEKSFPIDCRFHLSSHHSSCDSAPRNTRSTSSCRIHQKASRKSLHARLRLNEGPGALRVFSSVPGSLADVEISCRSRCPIVS